MPVQAIIEQGTRPAYDLTDETGVLVTKLSIKPTREYVERKNSQRMVSYVRAENPRITFEFSGIIVGDSATRLVSALRSEATQIASVSTGVSSA